MNKRKVMELLDKAISSLEIRKKDEKQAYPEINWLEQAKAELIAELPKNKKVATRGSDESDA